MRVVFAGGGTGGHLYPALAIARAMVGANSGIEPYFIGARRGIEREILPQTEFPHELLDLHPLYRARFWNNWRTAIGAISAWRKISRTFRSEKPACVVATGGYASGLVLAYAALHKIPIVLQEQNGYPGLTTRFFSRYAKQIHLGFPEAKKKLSPSPETRVYESGNPIEPPPDPRPNPSEARSRWGFLQNTLTLLVYGGSQGARAINDAVAGWLGKPLPEGIRVIWSTGKSNFAAYSGFESEHVRVRAYISPMSDAYAASDIAISRGGAMATAELCAWGIPPIIVPLPTAAADHQTYNARALASAGAAEWIPQSEFNPERLQAVVTELLANPAKMRERKTAALQRARPNAAKEIGALISTLLSTSA